MKRLFQYPVISATVLDGDTIAVVLDQGFNCTIAQHCRLLGIDTPEKDTKAGRLVKQVLERKIADSDDLSCQSVAMDKYCGRFVGILRSGEVSINDWLIAQKLGKPYFGKKKEAWADAELSEIETFCGQFLGS